MTEFKLAWSGLHCGKIRMRCEDQQEASQRFHSVSEADTWLNTPFKDLQCVKGRGVDCAQFIIHCHQVAGVKSALNDEERKLLVAHSQQWHLHADSELYIDGLSRYCRRVEVPDTGDIILWRPPRWLSQHYSNAALVIEWPRLVIGADFQAGVVYMDPEHDVQFVAAAKCNPHVFFSPWPLKKAAE